MFFIMPLFKILSFAGITLVKMVEIRRRNIELALQETSSQCPQHSLLQHVSVCNACQMGLTL
jgi:hypothetical protein